jgi:cytochrome c553
VLTTPDAQPPLRIPSNVAWTSQTIAAASHGNALRGLVISRRCARCHGQEGFSATGSIPNLAGLDRLATWKQLVDFRDGKRTSGVMNSVAAELQPGDYADLAAYYSLLPTYPDPGDTRAFPEQLPASTDTTKAARLVTLGDGARGIPPCQACHGPVGYKPGAPSLMYQNSDYIVQELQEFARGDRSNDINMPMRSIASLLTNDEMQAIGDYYGSSTSAQPPGVPSPSP